MRRNILVGVALALVLVGGWSQSQDKEEAKPTTRRLPNNYSKVGLRQSQRDAVYAIQDKYADQIEDLIRQVEELRKQRDAEIEKVLNDEQRAELKKLMEEAASKSKGKKPGAASPADATKPTE